MVIQGFNGIIEFPKTKIFINQAGNLKDSRCFIVPVIRTNLDINTYFAVYGSFERAKQVLDEIILEWSKGTKFYEMPSE